MRKEDPALGRGAVSPGFGGRHDGLRPAVEPVLFPEFSQSGVFRGKFLRIGHVSEGFDVRKVGRTAGGFRMNGLHEYF